MVPSMENTVTPNTNTKTVHQPHAARTRSLCAAQAFLLTKRGLSGPRSRLSLFLYLINRYLPQRK